MTKKVIYAGHWKDEEDKPLSFNLYGYDDIDFKETKSNILGNMNNRHFKKLKKLFFDVGLTLHKLDYYSPKAYNYAGDSIDLEISITDKDKLKEFITLEKIEIQKALDSNKSYDGYIALTNSTISEVFEEIEKKNEVDSMLISYILSKYPLDSDTDFYDLLAYEYCDDD